MDHEKEHRNRPADAGLSYILCQNDRDMPDYSFDLFSAQTQMSLTATPSRQYAGVTIVWVCVAPFADLVLAAVL